MMNASTSLSSEVRDYPLDEAVGYLIARVRSSISNEVSQRTINALGITSSQASMLFMIGTGRCQVAADLARYYGIDASAVTRLIDRLEKRKLLRRVRSSEDRRAVRLELTPEGHAIAAQLPDVFCAVTDKALAGFTPEEVGFLKSMLRRILVNIGEPVEGTR
jgi:DNA-binding MarR family transcriptional regulator